MSERDDTVEQVFSAPVVIDADLSTHGFIEMGGQLFTPDEWEVVQAYAKGHTRSAVQDLDEEAARMNTLGHEVRLNIMAQRFYEASGLSLHGTDKPKVVEGLRAVQVPSMQDKVRQFHKAMGQPAPDRIQALPADRVGVRIELLREEFIDELIPALETGDLVESVDAAIDILYVTFGLLVEMGVDAQIMFDEVHDSNMSKFGADGKPLISRGVELDGVYAGRVMKGPNYFRPNLVGILETMQALEEANCTTGND